MARFQTDKQQARALKKQVRALLLVDDHSILREGVAHLIDRDGDLKVCGQADTPSRALAAANALKPDLIVVDIALKGGHGLEIIKRIGAANPRTPILVLSVQDETLFAERSLRAGARGYVMKKAPIDELMTAIRRVLRGSRYVSKRMQERLLDTLSDGQGTSGPRGVERLSNRELEVFQLVGQGCGTRQIADRLQLSVKTIETYRAHIKEKLRLRTGIELMRAAMKVAGEEQRF